MNCLFCPVMKPIVKKRGKKKKKTVTKWKDLSKYSGSVYVLQEKKCVHILGMDNFWMAARDCRKVSF